MSLVEHSSSAHPEDLYQYSLTAVLLTTYLQQRTKFFSSDLGDPDSVKASETEADEFFAFVSLFLLKHILQLVCNASAIFHVCPASPGASESEDVDQNSKEVNNNKDSKWLRINFSTYRTSDRCIPSANAALPPHCTHLRV